MYQRANWKVSVFHSNYKTSNKELLEALKKGDEVAFSYIYNHYWKGIFRVAYNKTKSKETAEELVQELFIELWRKREVLSINQLENYLFTAIKNAILDFYRSQNVMQRYVDYKKNISIPQINFTDETLSHNELSFALYEGITKLPLKSQKIFRMSRFENFSIKQIAKTLKISEKTVEYHITKALKYLKIILKDFI